MEFFLFIFIAAVAVATYIFISAMMEQQNVAAAAVDDFTFPTNDRIRAVPILYGSVWTAGNILEYRGLFEIQDIHD